MRFNIDDCEFEYLRGVGAGGTHRNCTNSCVRITHIPTGIQVTTRGRNQHQNKKKAIKDLKDKLVRLEDDDRNSRKKERRLEKIRPQKYIRTYNYSKGYVLDHRTKKRANLNEVVGKGKIDLLR